MTGVDLQRLVRAVEELREMLALGPTNDRDLLELTKAEADLAGLPLVVFARVAGVHERLVAAGYSSGREAQRPSARSPRSAA